MTSPDMQSPVGSLSPAAMNWLQDMLAKPIGQEGKQILQALAGIGDSMLSRFFKGYTDIADVFAHAFDDLGTELGGIPGMSGVQAWVDDIEGLLTNALDLIDNVFTGVTDIVDGLAFAVTGQGVEGNIAEGMHMVVQGLTAFLELANVVMDLITELIDGVLGVTGGTMSQLVEVLSWVIEMANKFLLFFNGIYDVFGDLLDFTPGGARPLAPLLAGLPKLLTIFSNLDAGKLIGEIPTALLAGVQGAIDDVSGFLQDFVDAVLQAIRGIPVVGGTLADIIAEVGNLNSKAVTAQSTATSAQATAANAQSTATSVVEGIFNGWFGSGSTGAPAEAQQTIEAIKDAVMNGYLVQTVTSSGTWTKPANLSELTVICVGAGQNGANGSGGSGGAGGLSGGFLAQAINPTTVASTVALTIGASNGAATSFGSHASSSPGAGGIATAFGYSSTSSIPGDGGKGGNASTASSGSPGRTAGVAGGPTPLASGGAAGTTSSSSGGAGGSGGAVSAAVPTKCGGGGAGGGGGGGWAVGATGGNGGNGGYPGGGAGGGGGSSKPYYSFAGNPGTGGTGAGGVMWIFTKTGA